jgi:hypothetical protein
MDFKLRKKAAGSEAIVSRDTEQTCLVPLFGVVAVYFAWGVRAVILKPARNHPNKVLALQAKHAGMWAGYLATPRIVTPS